MGRVTPVLQHKRRGSHVAGYWGFAWLYAHRNGRTVLKEQTVWWRHVNGFIVRTPKRYVTIVWRYRRLK